ncbi:MAG: flagellar hook-associated protein FlgL [Gammaproteobacteria bacterium]|nr:flagellar hook-associated protein FlgL [Gammaproteobacteria bacterium]MDH5652955.1 flagellar hook-associated protein FlgL [Gammaproteobacteria bacterium]
MGIRVSTNQIQMGAINAMLDQQDSLARVQQQVATGKRVLAPSDDPVAVAQSINLQDALRRTEQLQRNIDNAQGRLSLEEGVLDGVTTILQRVRELTVAANNATQTNDTRSYIAEEIAQLNDELVGLANTMDSDGEFLFAGSKGRFRPFSKDENSNFLYYGDDTQRYVRVGPRRTVAINDTGTQVFRKIREGNGTFIITESKNNTGSGVLDQGSSKGHYDFGVYALIMEDRDPINPNAPLTYKVIDDKGKIVVDSTPFSEGNAITFEGVQLFMLGEPEPGDFYVIRPSQHQDIFTTLQKLTNALKDSRNSAADHGFLHNEVNRALASIDTAMGNILDVRASIGTRLNALESQRSINEAFSIQLKELISKIEDLDFGQAVSELNGRKVGLEASQKAFVKVQDISLFNHLY